MKLDFTDNICQKDRQSGSLAIANFICPIADKWTSKPPKEKNLNNAIYAEATILKKEHNCSAFFIKLNFSQNAVSIPEQWNKFKEKKK